MSRFVFPQDAPKPYVYLEVEGEVWGSGPSVSYSIQSLFEILGQTGRENASDWTTRPFTSIPTSLFTNKEEIK